MELELALDKHEPYARQRRKSLHPPQLISIIICGMLPPKQELVCLPTGIRCSARK